MEYRRTLALSLFYKFYLTAGAEAGVRPLMPTEVSATVRHSRPPTSARQDWEDPHNNTGGKDDSIGKPVAHLSAQKQATGQAVYTDDIPRYEGELFGAFVFSTEAHAKLVTVDPSAAVGMPGVAGYFGAADVPGSNKVIS